jgi:hypothetical protein
MEMRFFSREGSIINGDPVARKSTQAFPLKINNYQLKITPSPASGRQSTIVIGMIDPT